MEHLTDAETTEAHVSAFCGQENSEPANCADNTPSLWSQSIFGTSQSLWETPDNGRSFPLDNVSIAWGFPSIEKQYCQSFATRDESHCNCVCCLPMHSGRLNLSVLCPFWGGFEGWGEKQLTKMILRETQSCVLVHPRTLCTLWGTLRKQPLLLKGTVVPCSAGKNASHPYLGEE